MPTENKLHLCPSFSEDTVCPLPDSILYEFDLISIFRYPPIPPPPPFPLFVSFYWVGRLEQDNRHWQKTWLCLRFQSKLSPTPLASTVVKIEMRVEARFSYVEIHPAGFVCVCVCVCARCAYGRMQLHTEPPFCEHRSSLSSRHLNMQSKHTLLIRLEKQALVFSAFVQLFCDVKQHGLLAMPENAV